MKLNIIIGESTLNIEVPIDMLDDAESIYSKMDKEMDNGGQMYRDWVDELSQPQRCQIVANRLLTAIENENEPSSMLMAGYIMSRMPGVANVEISTDGDITQTQLS